MNHMSTIENTNKICQFIFDKYNIEDLNNDSLVQIIELCGSMLNLKTIQQYADENSLTYNGVKKGKLVQEIIGTKFVINNN